VITFALLTALGSYAQVRVPGLLVPVTLQTLVVSLAGALLGARLGALSQAAYLLAGALGAPVFAGGMGGFVHLMGPTGGYLLAFPLAAAVTGWLTARWIAAPGRGAVTRLALGILLGTFVVFIGGAAQLTLLSGDPVNAVRVGVLPFLAGDVLKVVAATLIARRWGRRARTLF
jgi:biotin transport system substrate-specific component